MWLDLINCHLVFQNPNVCFSIRVKSQLFITLKLYITINRDKIENIDNFNFLRFIIIKNLKLNSHVDYIASKMSRSIELFMILRHRLTLPTDILVLLYNSIILPSMTYSFIGL